MKRLLKYLLRLLMAAAACLILATGAWAAKTVPDRNAPQEIHGCWSVEPEAQRVSWQDGIFVVVESADDAAVQQAQGMCLEFSQVEALWEKRPYRDDVLFLVTLQDREELVRQACGWLEVNYRFQGDGRTGLTVSKRSLSQLEWSEREDVPLQGRLADSSRLRLRCFLCENGESLCLCRELTVIAESGELLCHTVEWQTASPGEQYALRVETVAQPDAPEAASAPWTEAEAALPVETAQRTWVYVSSDDRPLWSVNLRGLFQGGTCLSAEGEVAVLDEFWRCEAVDFLAEGSEAVARVTVRRVVLGLSVALQQFEFCLCPPP